MSINREPFDYSRDFVVVREFRFHGVDLQPGAVMDKSLCDAHLMRLFYEHRDVSFAPPEEAAPAPAPAQTNDDQPPAGNEQSPTEGDAHVRESDFTITNDVVEPDEVIDAPKPVEPAAPAAPAKPKATTKKSTKKG